MVAPPDGDVLLVRGAQDVAREDPVGRVHDDEAPDPLGPARV
jgi:hypothetical protein